MKRNTLFNRLAVLSLILLSTISLISLPAVVHAQPQWQIMTIPALPEGAELGSVWTSGPDDTYIGAQRTTPGTTDVPEATLYHWDGTGWNVALFLPNHALGDVFGTSPTDVYVTANKCAAGYAAGCGSDRSGRIFRSTDGGNTWVPQALPPEVGTTFLYAISGTPDNVHVRGTENYVGIIVRFDGSTWSVYEGGGDRPGTLTVFSADEGYYGTCWGWGGWDGNTWQYNGNQFDFCDINRMWGMRDGGGALHLYTVGSNNFGNGVRVWKFDEATQSFGSKYGYVFGDGNGYLLGSAIGIWGSDPDNIYVPGFLGSWSDPTDPSSGRLYHFDGTTWQRVTEIGDIPRPSGIWGSNPNNIWIPLRNGQVLYYGPPLQPPTEASKEISGVDRITETPIFDVFVGDIFTYTIEFENPFVQVVYVMVNDTLDTALDYVSDSLMVNGTSVDAFNNDELLYTDHWLEVGASLSLTFEVEVQNVPVGSLIDNSAWITAYTNPSNIPETTLAEFEAIAPQAHVVPEPTTLLLFGMGFVGISVLVWRKLRKYGHYRME